MARREREDPGKAGGVPKLPSRSALQEQVAELVEHVSQLLEQQAAISNVLRAIARAPDQMEPIFDAILDRAMRLCEADAAAVRLSEPEGLRLVAKTASPELLARWPLPEMLPHDSYIGRLTASKAPAHIPDVSADQAWGDDRLAGNTYRFRTGLFIPMLKDNEVIGLIALGRSRVRPFTARQIGLFTDFAAQATIALEITRREQQYREIRTVLEHANRVATIGQLSTSIAHELKQPLSALMMNSDASLRWLTREPADVEQVRRSVERTLRDAHRAVDIIEGVRGLARKATHSKGALDLNAAILEVVALTHSEAIKNGVVMRTKLDDMPRVQGDKVQLQQVVLNLVVNAIQAMRGVDPGARQLEIRTETVKPDGVRVDVQDSGPGLTRETLLRLFEPFYTTKSDGMGMGLSICRSIIEAHGGRLWATGCEPAGALFRFTIPTG